MNGREGQDLVHEERVGDSLGDGEIAVQLNVSLCADHGPACVCVEVVQEFQVVNVDYGVSSSLAESWEW